MKKILALTFILAFSYAWECYATPSTQIWIPSTDIQKFATVHLNIDSYVRLRNEPNGTRKAPLFLIGPTVGILPWEKLQAEVGFDVMYQGDANLDKYPIYFNAKVATPEDSMFTWSPAVAIGGYNFGVKSGVTTQDIGYALAARTFPIIGRLTGGYFYGNKNVLVDENGDRANHGPMASWDRTMKEINEKLWLCVDYQGSRSNLGAVNFGFSWTFAPNVSTILGYDLYLNRNIAGRDTATVQVDINF